MLWFFQMVAFDWDGRINLQHFCGNIRALLTSVLYMTLNCIGWWHQVPKNSGNLKYSSIIITLRSSLTRIGSTC